MSHTEEIERRHREWIEYRKRQHEGWARSWRGRAWLLGRYLRMGYVIRGWAALWSTLDVKWK